MLLSWWRWHLIQHLRILIFKERLFRCLARLIVYTNWALGGFFSDHILDLNWTKFILELVCKWKYSSPNFLIKQRTTSVWHFFRNLGGWKVYVRWIIIRQQFILLFNMLLNQQLSRWYKQRLFLEVIRGIAVNSSMVKYFEIWRLALIERQFWWLVLVAHLWNLHCRLLFLYSFFILLSNGIQRLTFYSKPLQRIKVYASVGALIIFHFHQ